MGISQPSRASQLFKCQVDGVSDAGQLCLWSRSGPVVMLQKSENVRVDAAPLYDANMLTKGGDVATIRLGDQFYVLRITRAGKLILTK